MLKNTRLIVATVGIAAALIAGASVYGVTLALADNPPASRSAAQSTVTTAKSTPGTGQAVRAQVLDMLKDHMGITGAQAEQLATTMTELMQKNGITNISEMLKLCTEAGGMMTG